MKVAVLGTGIMGAGVARTLLREGFDVRVWNRSPAKAEPLASAGATVSPTATDAVRGAGVVVTLLFDAEAVVGVLEDAADAFGDAVVLQASTIGLDGTRRVAEVADRRGITVVDAPVLGTKQPAEQGNLVPLVSGDPAAVDRARPVLDAIGAKTVIAGERVGQATALKLVCNAWVASLTGALGQSITMAERLGLDPALFLEAIAGGPTGAPYAQVKGAAMIEHSYATSFSVDGVVKDVGLMRAAAQEAGVADDLLAAVEGLFRATADRGLGDDDMAAVRETF
ncbi:NAD(P)-dependent oxidoreductase [Solicola gregarius]|uniref:NAD(P)-dependent oxidoreductase n=1 Tax=Solicola gregarius TaxID=2908642 RepID=A0AA46TI71_9ACTN|nr:NAD(P)-dependent oxidoreductase [Solicola gregarius]UYM05761.1 NAD(P)-dependent oxidoreductase [Solicola gregarius]